MSKFRVDSGNRKFRISLAKIGSLVTEKQKYTRV